MRTRIAVMSRFTAVAALALSMGCNSKPAIENTAPTTTVGASGHTHEGWWCDEHGLPEEICALCNPKKLQALKAKGDWCAHHDCPDSQCFECHPELEAKFAVLYEAKFGEKPPARKKD